VDDREKSSAVSDESGRGISWLLAVVMMGEGMVCDDGYDYL